MSVEQILSEIALMPRPIRAFIAEKILEMLDVEEKIDLSPKWLGFVQQRIADIDAGVVQMVEAEKVVSQIWSELG